MTYKELKEANIEWQKQAEVDRLVIHNQLKVDHRQPNETISDYRTRVKEAQLKVGYKSDDYVISW